MPTFVVEIWFKNDYRGFGRNERDLFRRARKSFVAALKLYENGGHAWPPLFPATLRIKNVKGHPGIWELSWNGDGRCTWSYGEPQLPGKVHIVWRRIGGHDIFGDP